MVSQVVRFIWLIDQVPLIDQFSLPYQFNFQVKSGLFKGSGMLSNNCHGFNDLVMMYTLLLSKQMVILGEACAHIHHLLTPVQWAS